MPADDLLAGCLLLADRLGAVGTKIEHARTSVTQLIGFDAEYSERSAPNTPRRG
jgi:hypothetical protein